MRSVGDSVYDLSAVQRRIDVHAERALAEWRIDDSHNRFSNRCWIGIRRLEGGETLQRHIRQIRGRAGGIFLRPLSIGS
jgi:hypothetical protein